MEHEGFFPLGKGAKSQKCRVKRLASRFAHSASQRRDACETWPSCFPVSRAGNLFPGPMTLSAIELTQDELARVAPIIAHVGSALGSKASAQELRGGTVRMLDEVCRGAGIRPADIRDKTGLDREFRKLEHVLFSSRRTGERFTVQSVVSALRSGA